MGKGRGRGEPPEWKRGIRQARRPLAPCRAGSGYTTIPDPSSIEEEGGSRSILKGPRRPLGPRTPAPPPSRGRGSRNLPSRGDLVPKQRGKSGTPGTYTLETKRDIAGQSAPAARTGRLHSIPLPTVGRTIGHEPVDPTFKALCRKGPGDLPSGRVRPGAGRRVAPSRKLSPHPRRCSRRPGLGEIRKKTFETSHGSRRISPRTHEISPAPEIGGRVRTAFTPGVAFPQVWL